MDNLSKDTFKLLFNLQKSHPWVSERAKELEVLLFKDCRSKEHRELILELINNFEYLSNKTFHSLLNDLAENIVTDPKLKDDTTQVVAMAADSSADSSQYVLYSLKPIFEKLGWQNYKHVNTFGSAFKTYKRSNNYNNIVLIDEFIGTGNTLIGRVKEIQKTFFRNGINNFTIRARVLVSTRMGVEKISAEGIDIDARVILRKGISECFDKSIVNQMLAYMIELESILLPSFNGRNLPSLGYGGSEALFCRENGNAPNSVFPVFWWPFYKNNDRRLTLLTRAMGDA